MVQTISFVCLLILFICIALNAVRIILGPTIADRSLAADAMFLNLAGLAAVYSIYAQTAAYYDLVLTFSLLGFIGTVCFAKYLSHGRIIE